MATKQGPKLHERVAEAVRRRGRKAPGLRERSGDCGERKDERGKKLEAFRASFEGSLREAMEGWDRRFNHRGYDYELREALRDAEMRLWRSTLWREMLLKPLSKVKGLEYSEHYSSRPNRDL